MHVGIFCDEKLEKGSEVVSCLRRSEETTMFRHILVVRFVVSSRHPLFLVTLGLSLFFLSILCFVYLGLRSSQSLWLFFSLFFLNRVLLFDNFPIFLFFFWFCFSFFCLCVCVLHFVCGVVEEEDEE